MKKQSIFENVRLQMLILLLILSNFLSFNAYAKSEDDTTTVAGRLKQHIKYLASDELQGRFAGTEGNRKAADYIASYFSQIGLQPLGNNYRQPFMITASFNPGAKSNISFDVIVEKPGIPRDQLKPVRKTWVTGPDWMPLAFTENGTVTGELYFVGYGITAKDLKYDDYDGIDVKDKIVIVLSNSPDGSSEDGEFSPFIKYKYKVMNARDHGAKGIIFIKINSDSANVFEPLTFDPTAMHSGLLAIQANRTSIAKFFPRSYSLFPLEQEINKNRKPKSFPIPNTTITMNIELEPNQISVDNIVGMVKGTDTKFADEYIVVGAHYDHLGYGGPASAYKEKLNVYGGKIHRIHNGADDNASGTAGVMELARKVKENPLKRSVIFVCFNGEEIGIQGSSAYVSNPPVSLEKTVTMLNLDMVGRLRNNNLSVFGTGSSPTFDQLVDKLSKDDTIDVTKSKEAFGGSDQSPFYYKEIPVMMFFTGAHEDYHTPEDKWEKINFKGEAYLLRYVSDVIANIANTPEKPKFVKGNDFNKGPVQQPSFGGGAWFGIVPDFAENPIGFRINGTSPGSPAQKAGLKEKDVITKFGDKTIKNLSEYSAALKAYKPGDKVMVEILRGEKYDQKLTLEVTLTSKK